MLVDQQVKNNQTTYGMTVQDELNFIKLNKFADTAVSNGKIT